MLATTFWCEVKMQNPIRPRCQQTISPPDRISSLIGTDSGKLNTQRNTQGFERFINQKRAFSLFNLTDKCSLTGSRRPSNDNKCGFARQNNDTWSSFTISLKSPSPFRPLKRQHPVRMSSLLNATEQLRLRELIEVSLPRTIKTWQETSWWVHEDHNKNHSPKSEILYWRRTEIIYLLEEPKISAIMLHTFKAWINQSTEHNRAGFSRSLDTNFSWHPQKHDSKQHATAIK